MGDNLQIIDLKEFLWHPELLKRKRTSSKFAGDNAPFYRMDEGMGKLDDYRGTYVAYKEGVLCGQSQDKDKLLREAALLYEKTNLTVFEVPKNRTGLEKCVAEAV